MTPQEKIKRAKSIILLKNVFFGALICQTPIVETRDVPTAATDMFKIYWNPDFIEQQTLGQTVFTLLHELMHIVGKHGFRLMSRDHRKFNIACDYFINLFLRNAKYELVDGIYVSDEYKGLSSETIYDRLPDPPKPKPKPASASGDGAPQPGGAGGGGADDSEPEGGGLSGDLMDAPAANSAEGRERIADINTQVARAATQARMAGQLSVELERLVTDILDSKVPWYELMQEYFSDMIKGGSSWTRRNRRVPSRYMPGRAKEPAMGEVIFIGDASGSITDEMFQMIGSEAAGCAEQLNPSRFRMVWATTRVVAEDVFERGEELVFKSPESGGTDMRVPLKHVEQYDPAVVVLITDGYTPWPDCAPPYPLIVCCTTDTKVPFGRVVRV